MDKLISRRCLFGITDKHGLSKYMDYVLCINNKYMCLLDFVHYMNTGINYTDLVKTMHKERPTHADYYLEHVDCSITDYVFNKENINTVFKTVQDLDNFIALFALGHRVPKIIRRSSEELQDELIETIGKNAIATKCIGKTRFGYVYIYGSILFQVTEDYADTKYMHKNDRQFKTGLNDFLESLNLPKVNRVPEDVFNYLNCVDFNYFLKYCDYEVKQVPVNFDPLKAHISIETFSRDLDEDAKTFDVIVSTERCLTSEILQAHKPQIIKAANSVAISVCRSWGYKRKEFCVYDLKINKNNDFKVSYKLK